MSPPASTGSCDAAMIWLARKIDLYEEDAQLPPPRIVATRMSLESDRSFGSYEQALAHLNGPALTNEQYFSYYFTGAIYDALGDSFADARAKLKALEGRMDEGESASANALAALLPPS